MRSHKLFLGGLTKATTTELLYETFSPYGLVVDAVVMERNGVKRGFGFVTFADQVGVEAVMATKVLVDGRQVDIKRAVPEEEMEPVPTKVFVGGLPQKVDKEKLRDHFQRYGEVRDCVVMMDRTTGRSRGFGFVRFASADAVAAVLSAPQVLEGQVVDCKRAVPAEQLPQPKPRAEPKQAPHVGGAADLAWLQASLAAWSLPQPAAFPFGFPPLLDPAAMAAFSPAAMAAFSPAAFDPSLFDASAFDPAAASAFSPAFFNASLATEEPALPLAPEKKAAAPLGDLSNILNRANANGKKKAPAVDTENMGFSSNLKDAMKTEAASVAALAFAK